MGEIAQNKRMELIHQIRQEHYQNRRTLQNREGILYGNEVQKTQQEHIHNPFTSFKIRFAIALFLFVTFLVMKIENLSFGNLNAEIIRQEICQVIDITSYFRFLK